MKYLFLPLALLFTTFYAQTAVSNIQGFYRSGQVFLTWNKISDNTAFYKVYRSTSPITSGSQLATSEYLGYTNSKSAVNHNLTNHEGTLRYLRLDSAGTPLASSTGLFVATTLINGSYYYAVTTLINNVENTTIISGDNSLTSSIAETVATPLPVFQLQKTIGPYPVDIYTNFVSSKYATDQPLQFNAGFVTYDFAVNLNNATGDNPVRFFFHGGGSTYIDDMEVTSGDEVRIQIEDYFPDSTISSAWWGSNPAYDIYNADNNVAPTTGMNTNYSQQRISRIIDWAIKYLPIDSNRIYFDATSDGSGPAFFYAITYPEKLAAIAVNGGSFNFSFLNDWLPNCSLNAGKKNRKEGDKRLGTVESNLMCNLGIHTFEAFNGGWMIHEYPEKDYPVIYSLNGKQDKQTGWTEKTIFYDSLNANRLGGYFFWDNRDHGGSVGKTWKEGNFDLKRYRRNISYPAFSFCSLNEDFGDGNGLTGEDYGTINGPLDWSDEITDETQTWAVQVFMRDLLGQDNTVIVYPDSCTVSITPRRLQHFNATPGSTIDWQVTHQGTNIQSGSFTYDGGLIVIPQVKIFRDTSTITLTLSEPPTATITPSGTVNECKGIPITLTANTGAGLQYQWKKGTSNISAATASFYTTGMNETGSFSVIVTNTSGVSATSAPTTITRINPPPATITPQGDLDICVTGQVTLQANGGGGLSYQWQKGMANIAGATAQSYVATKKASYKVIVTNPGGCSKTSAVTKVTKSCRLGDVESGIPESEIFIHPVPNNGNFEMVFRNFVTQDSYGEDRMSGVLSIYDVSGRKLFQEPVEIMGNEFSREIRLSDTVEDGVYFIEFLVAGNKMVKMMVVSKSNP